MSGNQNSSKNSVFAGQKTKVMSAGSYAMSSNSTKKFGNNTKSVPVGSCGGKSMTGLKKK